MKDLKWLSVEDYATSPLELTVIGCMKGYLCGMTPQEALKRLSEIIKPKVIQLNEGGAPLPVQSSLRSLTMRWPIQSKSWNSGRAWVRVRLIHYGISRVKCSSKVWAWTSFSLWPMLIGAWGIEKLLTFYRRWAILCIAEDLLHTIWLILLRWPTGSGFFIGEVVRRIFQEYSLSSADGISFQGWHFVHKKFPKEIFKMGC